MSSFSSYDKFVYKGTDLEAMSFAQNYHNWIYELISAHLGKSIAEIGSGVGNFTKFLLREKDVKIDAYEPCSKMHNKNMYALHKQVNCINDNFERKSSTRLNFYDSIVFINVLEHIEDDISALKTSHRILNSKGKIVIFVPALKFLYSKFDHSIGHFRRYSKSELLSITEKSGFKVLNCKYFDSFGIIPWFFFMKVLNATLNHKNTLYYDRLVVPWLKILEKYISPPLGKNLLLVAKK